MPSQTNDLANVTIRGAHTKSIVEIAQQLAAGANKVRQGKDDDFEKSKPLLKALPTWVLNLVVRSAVTSHRVHAAVPVLTPGWMCPAVVVMQVDGRCGL